MGNGTEPAFARAGNLYPSGDYECPSYGLTKREYFAAMAMQGLCANAWWNLASSATIARWSIEHADALIAALAAKASA